MPSESVNFDHAAGFYDATRGYPPGIERDVARFLAHAGGFSANSRVLEIGIGTGRVALPLAEHVGSIHGVDISSRMIGRLLEKRSDARVLPVIGDARMLPYPDDHFDAVVITRVLHLVAEPGRVVDEVRRVLRPDGSLLHCSDRGNLDHQDLYEASNAAIGDERLRNPNWRGGTALLDDLGWQRSGEAAVMQYRHMVAPVAILAGLENRVWSSLWHVSDASLARGAAAMRAAIAARFDDPETPVEVTGQFSVAAYRPPG